MKNNSEKEFEQYREALKNEIIRFASFLYLFKRINERSKDRIDEINIAPAFFQTVLNSLSIASIIWVDKLCSTKSERGLYDFLTYVEKNVEIFSDENWIKRRTLIKADPDKYFNREISNDIIKQDKSTIESLPKKAEIKKIRDKTIAHSDKEFFYDIEKIKVEANIHVDEIISTLDVLRSIYNRYSVGYDGVNSSLKPININDIDQLLDIVHKFNMES